MSPGVAMVATPNGQKSATLIVVQLGLNGAIGARAQGRAAPTAKPGEPGSAGSITGP